MANPALGTKRVCSGCSAKFYDLGSDPIVCPTCETVYVIPKAPPPRGRHGFTPRSVYDPNAQVAGNMGTLKETAPGIAVDDEAKEDAEEAEVAEIETEDAEADGTEEAGGVPMLEELDEK